MWRALIYGLTWLAGEPGEMDVAHARAAASVSAARASMATAPPAPPTPPPQTTSVEPEK